MQGKMNAEGRPGDANGKGWGSGTEGQGSEMVRQQDRVDTANVSGCPDQTRSGWTLPMCQGPLQRLPRRWKELGANGRKQPGPATPEPSVPRRVPQRKKQG